jgi:hypothetical protein
LFFVRARLLWRENYRKILVCPGIVGCAVCLPSIAAIEAGKDMALETKKGKEVRLKGKNLYRGDSLFVFVVNSCCSFPVVVLR